MICYLFPRREFARYAVFIAFHGAARAQRDEAILAAATVPAKIIVPECCRQFMPCRRARAIHAADVCRSSAPGVLRCADAALDTAMPADALFTRRCTPNAADADDAKRCSCRAVFGGERCASAEAARACVLPPHAPSRARHAARYINTTHVRWSHHHTTAKEHIKHDATSAVHQPIQSADEILAARS